MNYFVNEYNNILSLDQEFCCRFSDFFFNQICYIYNLEEKICYISFVRVVRVFFFIWFILASKQNGFIKYFWCSIKYLWSLWQHL